MRLFHNRRGTKLALVAILLASPAFARSTTDVVGDWQGTSKTKVRVARLGSDRDTTSAYVSIDSGTWAAHDTAGYDYSGTWSPRGRKLTWNYDGAGRAELGRMLDAWADSYGYSTTTTVGTLKTKGKAKDGRGGKSLKITVNGKFTINVNGKSRRGKLKIVSKFRPD